MSRPLLSAFIRFHGVILKKPNKPHQTVMGKILKGYQKSLPHNRPQIHHL